EDGGGHGRGAGEAHRVQLSVSFSRLRAPTRLPLPLHCTALPRRSLPRRSLPRPGGKAPFGSDNRALRLGDYVRSAIALRSRGSRLVGSTRPSSTLSQPTHAAASVRARAIGSAAVALSRVSWRASRVRPLRAGSTRPTRRPPASSGIV